MQTKFSLAVIMGVASVIMLASCLVSSKDNKPKDYTITLPASLPLYASGDTISMQYASYVVNGTAQSPANGINGITMRWELASLTEPFTGGSLRTPVLRLTIQDAVGSAVQYIKQDSTGSIFLHGFGALGSTVQDQQQSTFWPDANGLLSSPETPKEVQVFWSPFADSTGASTTLDINYAEAGKMDFTLMGECTSSVCKPLADFIFTEHKVSPVKEVISTPLGNFQTYRLRYNGSMITRAMQSAPPHFDYRTSCWTPGDIGAVTFVGDVWIYPPIGPVKIQNFCTVGSHSLRYEAQIVGTNLPFE